MTKKGISALLIGVFLLAGLLVGCTRAAETPTPGPTVVPAAREPKKLEVKMVIEMGDIFFADANGVKSDTFRVPAGKTVGIHIVNKGAIEHEIMFGRELTHEAGMPHGYAASLLEDVPADVFAYPSGKKIEVETEDNETEAEENESESDVEEDEDEAAAEEEEILTAEEEEIAGATPDSPISWGIDRALERISLALTLGKSAKAQKGLAHAQERLMEVKAMIQAKKLDKAENAEKAHKKALERVNEAIEGMDGQEPEAELEEQLEIEQELEEQEQEMDNIRVKSKKKLQLTAEQQAKLDELIASLKGSVGEAKVKVEIKKNKIKIKVQAKTGKSAEEVEKAVKAKAKSEAKVIPVDKVAKAVKSESISEVEVEDDEEETEVEIETEQEEVGEDTNIEDSDDDSDEEED